MINSDANYKNTVSAKTIRDIYAYQSQKLLPTQDQVWVVAQVTPTPEQSQDPVLPRQLLDIPQYGDLHILLTLAGSADHTKERYAWVLHFPVFDLVNQATRKDAFLNSAFSSGGIVICCINKSINGQAQEGCKRYDPAYLLPPNYQDYVLPARNFSLTNPGLLEDQNAGIALDPQREKILHNLLQNSNPLLAVAAFRVLVGSGPIKTSEFAPYLEHQQGMQLALMCYILLKRSSQGAGDEGSKLLQGVISSAKTVDRLEIIGQSVRAAESDAAAHPPADAMTVAARISLNEKLATLNSGHQ